MEWKKQDIEIEASLHGAKPKTGKSIFKKKSKSSNLNEQFENAEKSGLPVTTVKG